VCKEIIVKQEILLNFDKKSHLSFLQADT